MSREKGILGISANFEVQTASPLDSRLKTTLYSDLILPETWSANDGGTYVYIGMITVVSEDTEENNGIYRLKDSDYTNIDNWVKISGGTGSISTSEINELIDNYLATNNIIQDNYIIYECGNSTLEEEIHSDYILLDCSDSI